MAEPVNEADFESCARRIFKSRLFLSLGAKKTEIAMISGPHVEQTQRSLSSPSNDRIKTDSYINLGATYMRLWHQAYNQQYLDKSIEASRNALEIDTEGYRSRLNLAVGLSKDRRTESEALKYFEEADERGDLRDPVLWGKIKLFKASLILTLTGRSDGAKYRDRIGEAELDLLEALRLFEMMKNHPEVLWLYDEAKTSLNLLKKRNEALFDNHRIHEDAR